MDKNEGEMKVKSIRVLEDGMKRVDAERLWDQVEGYASYSFNSAHSCAYSIVSYQSMWLKTHYPVEFFAAALSILKEDKLDGLVNDAGRFGIKIQPPNINMSTGRFEILNDKTLLVPFNRVKGISDNTTAAIMKARKECGGSFADIATFEDKVEKRRCNSKHRDLLDKVGAFASIVPGSKAADHPDRMRDQMDLMPGLVAGDVYIDREIVLDKFVEETLGKIVREYRECEDCSLMGGVHPQPRCGKKAKVVIVLDSPSWSDEREDRMGSGKMFEPIMEAMHAVGLSKSEVYVTSLIKAPKKSGDKFIPADALAACPKFLDRELEQLKSPIIVALGSNAARHFNKTIKGGIGEHNAKTYYDKGRDAIVVFGITPGQIAYDPGKQKLLNEVFEKVVELLP